VKQCHREAMSPWSNVIN